jgi:5'-nucleotidase
VLSGALLALTACGSGGDGATVASPSAVSSPSAVPSTTALPGGTGGTGGPVAPRATARRDLKVLLTNDDGVGAAGIDALARALRGLPGVDLRIVAPATNQSGTGSATTPGGASSAPTRTASGLAATAVRGYPADTVAVALDELGFEPDLVVSGVNRGVNAGSAVPISGTVGAARAAIARGVPALAASSAVPPSGGTPDFAPATSYVTRWISAHRAALLDGSVGTRTLVNVNTPWCPSGAPRGVRDVAVAKGDVRASSVSACRSSVTAPRTDVTALDNGWVAVSRVPAVLATPYPR